MEEKLQDRTSSSTRRIARNTLMLYFRQILTMLVSLYTVRVVLGTLGAQDYGIYNVVAGVVVLFSFVNNAMATATQRFLNYNLEKENVEKTQQTYSASLIIHAGIALIFILVAETVGLWFVNSKLNVPVERHGAAMWCYQFSVITTVFNILRVPYNAVIIAYEKMSFFAWISIIESVLKLLVVYLLIISPLDKLVAYVILLTFVSVIILFCYKLYCNRKFEIARYKRMGDISLIKEILGFFGWSLFGATANVANQQGTNIVLNVFTNVTVNAAMGIANQVNGAVYSFVSNFQTAFNPQLVKNYATGEKEMFLMLLFRASKVSFFLMYFLFLPLFVNTDYILKIWMKIVPDYSVSFVRLTLIWSMIDTFNNPLYTGIQATGDVKKYNIVISVFKLIPLPIIIFFLAKDFSPNFVYIIEILIGLVVNIWRMLYASKKCMYDFYSYLKNVIIPIALIVLISCIIMSFMSQSMYDAKKLIVTTIVSVIINSTLIFLIGMNKIEKHFFLVFLSKFFRRLK